MLACGALDRAWIQINNYSKPGDFPISSNFNRSLTNLTNSNLSLQDNQSMKSCGRPGDHQASAPAPQPNWSTGKSSKIASQLYLLEFPSTHMAPLPLTCEVFAGMFCIFPMWVAQRAVAGHNAWYRTSKACIVDIWYIYWIVGSHSYLLFWEIDMLTHCFSMYVDLLIIQGQNIHNAIRIQNKSSHHKGSTCQPDTPSHRVLSQLHRSVEGSGTITCQNKLTPICDAHDVFYLQDWPSLPKKWICTLSRSVQYTYPVETSSDHNAQWSPFPWMLTASTSEGYQSRPSTGAPCDGIWIPFRPTLPSPFSRALTSKESSSPTSPPRVGEL